MTDCPVIRTSRTSTSLWSPKEDKVQKLEADIRPTRKLRGVGAGLEKTGITRITALPSSMARSARGHLGEHREAGENTDWLRHFFSR